MQSFKPVDRNMIRYATKNTYFNEKEGNVAQQCCIRSIERIAGNVAQQCCIRSIEKAAGNVVQQCCIRSIEKKNNYSFACLQQNDF
jgi:hypothetical protein